jgi:hypothetical protein
MRLRRIAAGIALFCGTVCVVPPGWAETVFLKSGGAVRGTVVASPASGDVAVRTPSGGLIVLERGAIRPSGSAVALAKRAAGRKGAATAGRAGKSALTAEQKAWLLRVRSLVGRLLSDDPARSRRARDELLAIRDPAALAALERNMQNAPDETARRLYVEILRQIPGEDSTGLLVAQSLGDPSRRVRAEARGALDPPRAAFARRLYIDCLRSGSPEFYGVAAQGLAEIGDPHVESVPYLIEALVEHTTQSLYEPARPPRYSECMDEMVADSQAKFYSVPITEGRSDVLDALLKITDQPYPKFGYNVEQWRRWFAGRAKNAERGDARK